MIAPFLSLLVPTMAGGAHALDVGPIKEQITVTAMRADVVTDQIGAFMDALAAHTGEVGPDQCIPSDRSPFRRLVPFAPSIDPIP